MTRTLPTFFACAAAIAAAVVATISPVAPFVMEASAQDRCPAVAVVAARGSGQNFQVVPTRYAAGAPVSNGWEGETIRALLRTAEGRYAATHGGTSLMKDVDVIGLDPSYYPATYPAIPNPDIAVPDGLLPQARLVAALAIPAANVALGAANQFTESVSVGRDGVMRGIDDYQNRTGCAPQYVLMGYSQGAMVVAEHERELARRGQLAGVIYLGNPMTRAGDWSTVGVPGGGAGGMIGWSPINSVSVAATNNRVNYCLPQDGVCDTSAQTLRESSGNGGNHGRYFLAPSPWDDQVVDSFGSWVDQVRY